MAAPNPMTGIRRIDRPQKGIHGFEARVKRGGKYHSKFFSDKTHGGRESALTAAQDYYPLLLEKVGPPGSRPLPNQLPLRDGTPFPGVLVWVQCPDHRCLAYLDEKGHWFSFYTHQPLPNVIRTLY